MTTKLHNGAICAKFRACFKFKYEMIHKMQSMKGAGEIKQLIQNIIKVDYDER
jgi:hypothetical protein